MVTRKKSTDLDISIPSSKPKAKSQATATTDDLLRQLVELNENLTKLNTLMYSSDWKLWKMMNMIEMIANENGYTFKTSDNVEQAFEKESTK